MDKSHSWGQDLTLNLDSDIKVESKDWVDVALIYIGTEGAIDFATRLRGVLPTKKEDPQV